MISIARIMLAAIFVESMQTFQCVSEICVQRVTNEDLRREE